MQMFVLNRLDTSQANVRRLTAKLESAQVAVIFRHEALDLQHADWRLLP